MPCIRRVIADQSKWWMLTAEYLQLAAYGRCQKLSPTSRSAESSMRTQMIRSLCSSRRLVIPAGNDGPMRSTGGRRLVATARRGGVHRSRCGWRA